MLRAYPSAPRASVAAETALEVGHKALSKTGPEGIGAASWASERDGAGVPEVAAFVPAFVLIVADYMSECPIVPWRKFDLTAALGRCRVDSQTIIGIAALKRAP
jgi:hypothetical protein